MEQKITVNNININYFKIGKGDNLILLHGNGEDYHIFDELIEKLKHHYTIYAIDSRCHGKSDCTEEISYSLMADDIYEFISALNLQNTFALGFSDGAILLTLLELKYPRTFNKIILLGGNLSPNDFQDEVLEYIKEEFKTNKSKVFGLMLNEPNIKASDLSNIKVPCLVIYAENDLYKESLYKNLRENLKHSNFKTISNHDHGSYIINNDLLADDIIDFCQ